MAKTRIDTDWSYRGLKAIVLENELLRLDIFPEVGAKIYNLVYKPLDRNLLFHHPRIPLRKVPFGAKFDDWWAGGWDEMFPNDVPCVHEGEFYVDHGEVWAQTWDWQVVKDEAQEVCVYLRCYTPVTPALMEKWISLRADEALIHLRYRITNVGYGPFDFLWTMHPAVNVDPHTRIDMPATTVHIDENYRQRFHPDHYTYRWPFAVDREGQRVDMRLVLPPEARICDGQYATGLRQGWCAVTDTRRKIGLAWLFPLEVFNTVWMFLVYGGWRGLYTLLLEPSTGYPGQLEVAATAGRCACLEAGEKLECEVTALVYTGLSSVGKIHPDGRVEAQD